MGTVVDPNKLSRSGENCLRRLTQLASLGLPADHFIAAATGPVEAHVSRLIGYLIALSDVDASALGSALLSEVESTMIQTWGSRMDLLARGFGVHVRGDLPWQRFDTVVQARNAIVHGDGRLSDQQQAMTVAKLIQLKKRLCDELDLSWAEGRLAFSPVSAARTHDAVRQFIVDLDERILAAYPQVRLL